MPRVVVLGFDGMDLQLLRRWMDLGKLPNLQRLAGEGSIAKLESPPPVQSATAWASFATGTNPGKHGIYDFLEKKPESYSLRPGVIFVRPAEYLLGLIPLQKAQATPRISGKSFWTTAAEQGVRATVLSVPMSFPAETGTQARVLSGFPVPDARGAIASFSYWATDVARLEETVPGAGIVRHLTFVNDVATSEVLGPWDPTNPTNRLSLPVRIRWLRSERAVLVSVAGQTIRLAENEWSQWITLRFAITPFSGISASMRFCSLEATSELRLYGSPLNIDPRRPSLAISSPENFAARLARHNGLFTTVGWPEPTGALSDGRVDERHFLAATALSTEDRERIILDTVGRAEWDLFVATVETLDRVSHVMWRFIDTTHPMHDPVAASQYRDAILRAYERADRLVGRVRASLPKDAIVIVLSDHGFQSFRRGVYLNAWLVQQGFMTLSPGSSEQTRPVDWSRTKAYALGLGQIYVNLIGREPRGAVRPEEYGAIVGTIRQRLLSWEDSARSKRVVTNVYLRDDVYSGPLIADAPDLVVGLSDGYRVGWGDSPGEPAPDVIADNDRKWSGDHCGGAVENLVGVLIANRRVIRAHPRIIDLAPTVLHLFGIRQPSDLDGSPLLADHR